VNKKNRIQIYNTLSARKEPFEPSEPGRVRMYVCGITPYDSCHLGHARCYVAFDIVRRTLQAQGWRVDFIQNFTDIDDKIIARAKERGVAPAALAQEYIDDFFNKMDALGVERATLYPRVTGHLPEILALIQQLVDKKAAYVLEDGVYFSVRDWPSYGKLSKRPLEELRAGARVEINENKRDPLDFALWKGAKAQDPPEAVWNSPWGPGRPGWHIECSAMALKHLGAGFDIHGGGLDLVFPHHENEIAQSEAAAGRPFARVWMHNGFVTLQKEKMSKSLGNFFALSDIFSQYHPSVVRYLLLGAHYRSPLDFSQESLEQSRRALTGMKDAIARATRGLQKKAPAAGEAPERLKEGAQALDALFDEYEAALADDFNTPAALGILHRMLARLERSSGAADARYALEILHQSAERIGLELFPRTEDVLIPREVSELCGRREEARKNKNWPEADRLRALMLERGYVVEDTPQGARLLPKAGL